MDAAAAPPLLHRRSTADCDSFSSACCCSTTTTPLTINKFQALTHSLTHQWTDGRLWIHSKIFYICGTGGNIFGTEPEKNWYTPLLKQVGNHKLFMFLTVIINLMKFYKIENKKFYISLRFRGF